MEEWFLMPIFISSIMVITGLVGKWSKYFGDIDVNNALEFFYASCALYFGRNMKSAKGVEVAAEVKSSDGASGACACAQTEAGRTATPQGQDEGPHS